MAPRRSTQNDPQGMVDRNSRVAIAAAGFGVMYSGLYDVSAASGHNPIVARVLHKTYMQSLHRHAAGIKVPTDLMTVANVEAGARLYRATCAACHGAPGQTLSPIGQGIFPIAPESLTLRQHPMHDLIAKHKAVKQRRSNMYRDQCKQHPRQDSMDVPHRVSECGTCRGQAGEWHDA
jgi:cytochrome c1